MRWQQRRRDSGMDGAEWEGVWSCEIETEGGHEMLGSQF